MTDKGQLTLDAAADLSLFRVAVDGYSTVLRGDVRLYPLTNDAGALFFSKRPNADGKMAVTRVLVDYAT